MSAESLNTQQQQEQLIRSFSKQCGEPLSVIRWYAEMLKYALIQKKADQPFVDTVNAIHAKTLFLIGLLRNLFDYLSIEAGTFVLGRESAALRGLLAELQLQYTLEAESRSLSIAFDREGSPEAIVEMDAARIRTVLEILLLNALQYSDPGHTIALNLQEADGAVEVSVRDEGIGILPKDLTRLFTKGFRTEAAQRVVPDGIGLGLIVAKHIIEAHGGRIWAESEGEGKGSTFRFTIPRKAAA